MPLRTSTRFGAWPKDLERFSTRIKAWSVSKGFSSFYEGDHYTID
jgi:hypothetical protein